MNLTKSTTTTTTQTHAMAATARQHLHAPLDWRRRTAEWVGGEADGPRRVDAVGDESAVPGEANTAGDRGASRGADAGESTSGGAPVPTLPPAG
jgi:hypothetical protein